MSQEIKTELEKLKEKIAAKIKEYDDDGDGILESGELTAEEKKVMLKLYDELDALETKVGASVSLGSEEKEYGETEDKDKTKSSASVSVSEDGVAVGYSEGDGDNKASVGAKISSDSVEVSAGVGKESASVKVGKDGVELNVNKEIADGVEAAATISNEKLAASITKKWELKKKSKTFPFAAGPVPCYVEFAIQGELSLTAEGEADFKSGISKMGVKGEGNLTGTIGLGATAGIVKLGGELDIVPSLKAHGYLCYDSNKDKYYPDLSGLDGDLSIKGRIVLKAGDEVMNTAKTLGIAEETLTYVLVESDAYSLLAITSPGYDENGLKGEWQVTEGKDILKLQAKIESAYNELLEFLKPYQEFAGYVGGKIGEAYDATAEAAEDTYDSTKAAFKDIEDVVLKVTLDDSEYQPGEKMEVIIDLTASNDDYINKDQHTAWIHIELFHDDSGKKVHAQREIGEITFPEVEKIKLKRGFDIDIPMDLDTGLRPDGWWVNVWIQFNENSKQTFEQHNGEFDIYPGESV